MYLLKNVPEYVALDQDSNILHYTTTSVNVHQLFPPFSAPYTHLDLYSLKSSPAPVRAVQISVLSIGTSTGSQVHSIKASNNSSTGGAALSRTPSSVVSG